MSLNPIFQSPDQYKLASEISNKGNTSDLSLHDLYWNTYQKEEDMDAFLKTQLADGSWADIDYTDDARSNWQPTNHVSRLLYLTRVYITPASKFYHQKSVSVVIHRGLNYWFQKKPVCRNWWYNEIGVPRMMGLIFLFVEDELTEKEKTEAISVMNHSQFKMTGQNKVWLAGNVLMKALLTNDEKLAKEVRDTISSEIFTGTKEGIQPDFSFHQHGPQQQFGNYGLSFISSMAYFANVFSETPLAFSPNQLSILRNYALEGQNFVVWRGYMDLNACGRQFFKQAQIGKGLTLCIAVNQLKKADKTFTDNYDDILKRNLPPVTLSENPMSKHFWNSDLTVFRSENMYVSVRGSSPRVKGTEFTNNENKKGHFIADGSTIFMRNGTEYVDIFPFWDWNKIPGVTAPILDSIVPQPDTDTYKNPNPFVGGLTNNGTGISTFHLARNGVEAKKSWFYLKNVLVCLGTDIHSKTGKDIITGVNQCLQKGKAVLTLWNGKESEMNDTVINSGNLKTVWHDSIGYYFPQTTTSSLSLKTQTGNWHIIADPYAADSVSGKVFKLWIDHSVNATASNKYEYMVVPTVSPAKLNEFVQHTGIEVLENNANVQAVKLRNDSLFQFVFHKPVQVKTFSKDDFILSETNGLVMIGKTPGNALQLTVVDPTQLQKTFKLFLSGKYTGNFSTYNELKDRTEFVIPLPKKGFAGSSVVLELKQKSSTYIPLARISAK